MGGRMKAHTSKMCPVRKSPNRRKAADQSGEDRSRAQIKEALIGSGQRLRSIIDGSPIPAFVIGKDHRVLYWNKALEELSQIAASEVIGTNQQWRAFYGRERPCMADLLVDGAVKQIPRWYSGKFQESKLIEEAYEATDFFPELAEGGRWLRFTAAAIRDSLGSLVGAIETLEDITERKRAEDDLKESEQKLYSILQSSPIAAFVIGRDHRVLYWNQALEKLSRITVSEVIGTTQQWRAFYATERPCMADLLVDKALGKIKRWYPGKYSKSALVEGGYEATDFFPDLGKKGKWLRFTAGPIRNAEGKLIGAIETLEDVTARKAAEEALLKAHDKLELKVEERTRELARQEAALRQMTDHLSLILESLPIVSFTCNADRDFEITFVSNTIEEVTGYAPRQFLQDRLFWQSNIHPDDRQKIISEMRSGIKKLTHRCGYRFRIADGSYKWLSDYRKVIELPDGSLNIVGAWQDVTEEKKIRQEAELRLQQMIQTHKLTALGEVVAGVAHEINNPISFIAYNIPLLEEIWKAIEPVLADSERPFKNGLMLEEAVEGMEEIIHAFKTGSGRINRVISGLKEFARSEESAPKRPVRISEVIQGALLIVGSQVRRTVSSIDMRIEDNLPSIQGHFQKIEQVLTNLLINAHQSIPPGRKGRIVIAARYIARLKMILIEVEDNGTGMEKSVLDHLFEPFFTTRRERGGTGLGLSISYGLVKEHNGQIGVLSRPGLGSRFSVFLPAADRKRSALYPAMLCIDRDSAFLKELKTNFVDAVDWPLSLHDRVESVIRHLESHPEIDLVISEIQVPGINGWDLLEAVKKRFPLMAVMLYSDKPFSIESGRKGKAQPDFLVRRPFQIEVLQKAIRDIGRQRL